MLRSHLVQYGPLLTLFASSLFTVCCCKMILLSDFAVSWITTGWNNPWSLIVTKSYFFYFVRTLALLRKKPVWGRSLVNSAVGKAELGALEGRYAFCCGRCLWHFVLHLVGLKLHSLEGAAHWPHLMAAASTSGMNGEKKYFLFFQSFSKVFPHSQAVTPSCQHC